MLNKCRINLLTCLTLLYCLSSNVAVSATDLKGKVDSNKLDGQAGSEATPLQGGIKNEATLNPSLKVIPGRAKKSYPALQAETPQYFYPPGTNLNQGTSAAGSPTRAPMFPNVPSVDQYRGSGRVGHVIPPISTYTLTPRNGINHYGTAGYAGISTERGVTAYVPGYEAQKVQTRNGISMYSPGRSNQFSVFGRNVGPIETSHATPMQFVVPRTDVAMFGGVRHVPGPLMKEGVTAYAPGYEMKEVPTVRGGMSTFSPGHSMFSPTTHSIMNQHSAGYQVQINTPRNGVVCWDSRYESSEMSPGLIKHTLGGMWYENRPSEGLQARTQHLAIRPQYAQALVGPQPQSLQATPLGLPGIHPIPSTNLTWDEWYKRVARAIYIRWQNVEVGPGRATVAVTVTRDRALVGKVVEFTPAADVARNVKEETEFREAAVKAVNMVSEFEIPDFPPNADVPSVTFEVDMKREVDGPAGFGVAKIPDATPASKSEELKGEEPSSGK